MYVKGRQNQNTLLTLYDYNKAASLQNSTRVYPMHAKYNNVIPLTIYQTWHTKDLPPGMRESVEFIKNNNPAFMHCLYDDNDCRNFIKDNYDNDVLTAFDTLIPGAYKSDLWRYCILYKKGGIYLDIKYIPANGFKFINLSESEHFVHDTDRIGIYNALMVCKMGNPILLNAINRIVQNTKHKYYGQSSLEPTGPKLLASLFDRTHTRVIQMHHFASNNLMQRYICYNGYVIFRQYPGYMAESRTQSITKYYGDLWNEKHIYN